MDLNAIVAFVKANPAAMFALGLATAHERLILHYTVLGVFKFKPLRAFLVGNPGEAKEKLAALVAEVDADIDEVAKQNQVPASAPKI